MRSLDRASTASLLCLGGFILFSALQGACSSSDDGEPGGSGLSQRDGGGLDGAAPDGGAPGGAACVVGTAATVSDGTSACCTGGSCATPDFIPVGSACTTSGATVAVDQRSFTEDTCIIDSCTGDQTSQSYDATGVHQIGTLVCQSTSGALAWAWQSTPTIHMVERACTVVEPLVCNDDGYGYGYGSSGYGEDGYGTYGYGTGGGRFVRSVGPATSTCTGPDTAICATDSL